MWGMEKGECRDARSRTKVNNHATQGENPESGGRDQLIKGVSSYCKKILATIPGFQIEIRDGRVRLVHVFRARLWTSKTAPRDLVTLTYEKQIQVAEDSNVEAEMCVA